MVTVDGYVLGHTEAELKRLATPGAPHRSDNTTLSGSAWITEGMRVLGRGEWSRGRRHIACGPGWP